WYAVVLAGNQSLLSFNVFQNLQRTYSWMKYYNNEIDARNKGSILDENVLKELLQDVTKQINGGKLTHLLVSSFTVNTIAKASS
ncbi:MAG: hypothetical protein WBN72_07915, partial [Nitrososphaeraceae archaeon]